MISSTGVAFLIIVAVVFVLSILAIVWYMVKKHKQKSVLLQPWRQTMQGHLMSDVGHSRSSSTRSDQSQRSQGNASTGSKPSHYESGFNAGKPEPGVRDIDTHIGFIIPDGLRLLKTCKALTHKLMSTVIDLTSSDASKGIIVGTLDEVVSCAKMVSPSVDALTKSMYPPIDDVAVLKHATEMVNAVEELVQVAKLNCLKDKVTWLEISVKDVLHDYKSLVASVQKFRLQVDQPDDFYTET